MVLHTFHRCSLFHHYVMGDQYKGNIPDPNDRAGVYMYFPLDSDLLAAFTQHV